MDDLRTGLIRPLEAIASIALALLLAATDWAWKAARR